MTITSPRFSVTRRIFRRNQIAALLKEGSPSGRHWMRSLALPVLEPTNEEFLSASVHTGLIIYKLYYYIFYLLDVPINSRPEIDRRICPLFFTAPFHFSWRLNNEANYSGFATQDIHVSQLHPCLPLTCEMTIVVQFVPNCHKKRIMPCTLIAQQLMNYVQMKW